MIELVNILRPGANLINRNLTINNISNIITSDVIEPVYVYLASDNEEVKDILAEQLMTHKDLIQIIKIMNVETKGNY